MPRRAEGSSGLPAGLRSRGAALERGKAEMSSEKVNYKITRAIAHSTVTCVKSKGIWPMSMLLDLGARLLDLPCRAASMGVGGEGLSSGGPPAQ